MNAEESNRMPVFRESAGQQQEGEQQPTQIFHIAFREGIANITTSEHAAQRIASLERENERMRIEIERKDSTIFNLRFRSYLEGLGEAERQAVNAPASRGTTGLLKDFFDKALTRAIRDSSHPLHVVQEQYRQANDPTISTSSQVKQKALGLFPHFSRNIHKYFEARDEFELPRNLDVHDALLAELLLALKPTFPRDAKGKVDAYKEYARFV